MSKALKKLYKNIPQFECVPGCFDCCGPVPLCKEEAEKLGIPNENSTPFSKFDLTCSYATSTGCKVYENRPFLCRLFGVVEGMKCPKTKPTKMLSKKEEEKIMSSYDELLKLK